MANKEGHTYGGITLAGNAQAHLGDTMIYHHYHNDQMRQEDPCILLYESLKFEGMNTRLRNVTTALHDTCQWLQHHTVFCK